LQAAQTVTAPGGHAITQTSASHWEDPYSIPDQAAWGCGGQSRSETDLLPE